MTPEKKLEIDVINFLIANGQYIIKNQASPTTGKGKPDLSASINGRYVGLELKQGSKSSRTTYVQYQHLQRIAKSGGLAFYVNDLNAFKDLYNDLINNVDLSKCQPLYTHGTTVKEFLRDLNRHIHSNKVLLITNNGGILKIK